MIYNYIYYVMIYNYIYYVMIYNYIYYVMIYNYIYYVMIYNYIYYYFYLFSFNVLIILYTVMLRTFREVTESVKDANCIEFRTVMHGNPLKEKTVFPSVRY